MFIICYEHYISKNSESKNQLRFDIELIIQQFVAESGWIVLYCGEGSILKVLFW
jgi:UDP-N-acetylglucosamine transferase subunit ALG13